MDNPKADDGGNEERTGGSFQIGPSAEIDNATGKWCCGSMNRKDDDPVFWVDENGEIIVLIA
jgi:hypothetical protein